MANFLDLGGLQRFLDKIKSVFASKTDVNALATRVAANEASVNVLRGKAIFMLVDALPSTGEDNIIYLIPAEKADDKNYKNEYMWINNQWELIGSTSVDLSEYAKTATVNEKFSILEGEITAIMPAVQEEIGQFEEQIANKANVADVYSKGEVDGLLSNVQVDAYSKAETDSKIEEVARVTAYSFNEMKKTIGTDEELRVSFDDTINLSECESIMDALRVLDSGVVSGYVYTKAESDVLLSTKADKTTTYTKTEVDNKFGSITITTIGAQGKKTVTLATQKEQGGDYDIQDNLLVSNDMVNGILTLSVRELQDGYLIL